MHLLNALGIAGNSNTELFHNIIANIFQVVMVDGPVLPPHALYQLKPKLLLEVNALV